METLFWCICTLAIGILLGVLIEIDVKFYEQLIKHKKETEIKKARTLLMKIRDRQCTAMHNSCEGCEYNTEFGCLASSAIRNIVSIECINTTDTEEDTEDTEDE